ncbi:MAG TPA: 3-isopropylmalate dehydratase [Beijerinckiaceae bacterium]|nr:3-isopropylmalate dehydratase [Beijerinckiaceae bacterium]
MSEDMKTTNSFVLHGNAWTFGDDIPTDQIVPSKLLFQPLPEIAKQVLISLKPDFPVKIQKGDIMVTGSHFGQSSGRAKAPKALQLAGVGCIVAESFARTFLRNAYEVGLPIIECPGARTLAKDGDRLEVDLIQGVVRNLTTGTELRCRPIDDFLLNMLRAGGLIALLKNKAPGWEVFA